MPRPPALLTAATRSGPVRSGPIGAAMMGYSIPSMWQRFIFMNTSTFTAFPDSVTNRSEPATTRGHGLGATARLTLLMRNGKAGRSSVSWRDLPLFGDYCAHPELPGRDADEAVEVIGELALGREASAGSEL